VKFLPLLEKVAIISEYSVNAVDGAAVENDKFCVAVNYCNMNAMADM
jgi:trehalose-6-phosphatase